MASESWGDRTSLKEELHAHPARFEFFQVVRLLAKLRGADATVAPDDPGDDFVRFRASIGLPFPAADVVEIEPPGERGRTPVVTVSFMGAAAPASFGSLPTRYAQELLALEREKNPAAREFLDLFDNRMISLFYLAWEKYRLDAQYEAGGRRRRFETALFSLIGMGTPALGERLCLPERALLARAGALARTPAPASALEGLLESYFEVDAQIEQFVPGWYTLEKDEQNRLGQASSRLGEDLVLGERVRLSEYRLAVRLGPLDWNRYQDFFPSAEGFRALDSLLRLATAQHYDLETRLALEADQVPALRLERVPSEACRLGWSTWLCSDERTGVAEDAVLWHPADPLVPPLREQRSAA
jgi:type VI secretion system protein ImpH